VAGAESPALVFYALLFRGISLCFDRQTCLAKPRRLVDALASLFFSLPSAVLVHNQLHLPLHVVRELLDLGHRMHLLA
jgi:hypothetical protein